jgi:hypothetical protein
VAGERRLRILARLVGDGAPEPEFIRLRAYSFGNDRPLAEVARDVVARRLRFDAGSGEDDPGP